MAAVRVAAVLGALVEIPVMRMSGVLWHQLGAGKVFLLAGLAFAASLACFAAFSNPVLLVGVSLLSKAGEPENLKAVSSRRGNRAFGQ